MDIHLKYKNLSDEASNILSVFKDKNIIYLKEYLSHDGYDSLGPESNLWDLHIIIELNDDYIFYDYHWEDWYCENQVNEYTLWQPEINLSLTTKENIRWFKIRTKNNKFKKAFKERKEYFKKNDTSEST